MGRQMLAPDRERVTLPVCVYLVEHPRGLLLVDTGWCREISPAGIYDARAAARVLPPHLAAFYRPRLPEGMAVHEQLAARGIRPEDLKLFCYADTPEEAYQRIVDGAGESWTPKAVDKVQT